MELNKEWRLEFISNSILIRQAFNLQRIITAVRIICNQNICREDEEIKTVALKTITIDYSLFWLLRSSSYSCTFQFYRCWNF